MNEIERSRLWLNIEYQYWDTTYDELLRFSIDKRGYFRVEQYENLDPSDYLVESALKDFKTLFPRTASQFLEIIAEYAPKALDVPVLCTTTFNGDSEVLEQITSYLTFETATDIPEDEWDFVFASRAHTPKKGGTPLAQLKKESGFATDRILFFGDEELLLIPSSAGTFALSQKDFSNFHAVIGDHAFYCDDRRSDGRKFSYSLHKVSESLSLGLMTHQNDWEDEVYEYWSRHEGNVGIALGVFLRDEVARAMTEIITPYHHELPETKVKDIVDAQTVLFGKQFVTQTQKIALKLDLAGNDFAAFRSRLDVEDSVIDLLEKKADNTLTQQGTYEHLDPSTWERRDVEYFMALSSATMATGAVWQIQIATGWTTVNRTIPKSRGRLLDAVLSLLGEATLELAIAHDQETQKTTFLTMRDELQYQIESYPRIVLDLTGLNLSFD